MSTDPKPVVLLCPGQGAQGVGMAAGWVEHHPAAAATFEEARERLGFDLARLCREGPEQTLNRTNIAQVAIYVASVACWRALQEAEHVDAAEVKAAAGLSLGELTALHIAGAFDFQEGLDLVRERGEAMQAAAEAKPSSMLALMGADETVADQVCETARGDGVLVPANFNCPGQVVLSGSKAACERAASAAEELGLKATPLSVAGAFHSPLMEPAAERLGAALERVKWAEPSLPVYSNVTARPHEPAPDAIRQRLVEQLTHPVRWQQSVEHLLEAYPGHRYVELAPGKVLAGLMRRIDRKTKVENHAEPTIPAVDN